MKKQKLKVELRNNNELIKCAQEFGLLGDTTRMKICWLLCKHPELSVSEIAELLNVSLSAVSHSLRKLKDYKLVASRRSHKQIFYHFSDSPLNHLVAKRLKIL